MQQRSGYIDQWRGISVLAVIANHLIIYRWAAWFNAPHSHLVRALTWRLSAWGANEGMVGVDIFFVISGYLITRLLLKEEDEVGRISMKAFYLRRCARIMPAMFVYVGAVALLGIAGLIRLTPEDVAKASSYLCNTSWVACSKPYGHLWSIAVEEQFYLFWPMLLVLLGPFRTRFAVSTLVVSAICAVLPSLIIRGWLNNGLAVYCLSSGALYALSPKFRALFEPLRAIPTMAFTFTLIVLFSFAITRWEELRPVSLILLPPLIVATVLARDGNAISVDLSELLRKIGIVSYSLYLWQMLGTCTPSLFTSGLFLSLSFLSIPFAWISYKFVETPFIRLSYRWSREIIARDSMREAIQVID